MRESRIILYLVAFALLAIASASNGESAVFTNDQENNKVDANIPVVVVLKEQPLHEVSSKVKKEHRKRLKEITKSAKGIYSRIKPLTGSEEELRAKNISELVGIEQSLLTEKEKVLLVEVGKDLESNVTQMRREILARTAPLVDKDQKTIINKIRAKGGRVKYSSKVFNAIAADIPVSYIEELSKEEGVYNIYKDQVLNEDLDVSTGAMSADKWWSSGYTGANWDVAVVDSGIDGSHPALAQSVHYAGVFHDTAKTNSSYADNSSSTDDLRGHGTHTAGIVACTDPRYKGAAYGSKLINAKAGWLSKNGTAEMYESDAMKAIDWAIFGNPDDADVISFSFGNGSTNGDSPFEHFLDAVAYELDTPIAKSAGNGGPDSGTITNPGGAFNVITVGNVDDKNTVSRADDSLRASSSRGPTPDGRIKPDISAPGTNITSANNNWESEVNYVSKTGTSMAAPHIAGGIILLLNYKYYQTEAIKALLLNTAEDRGAAGPDNDYGFGYVDLSHAYIHRDDVFTGSVADRPDGSVEKFFKGNASIYDKATLVWNRHVEYVNSSYPTTYFNISNLDLYMYDEVSGKLVSSSTSGINNVEQVKSNAGYTSVVLKIEPDGIFPDGLEDYALAAEEGFNEVTRPGLNININNPGGVAGGTNFNMDVTVTNRGGIGAHNVSVEVALPSGFTIVSGANPQLLGGINAGNSKTAIWVVQAPEVTGSYTLNATTSSSSYGESYSGNNVSTITVDASGIPAYAVSGYVYDNYGTGLEGVLVQNGGKQGKTLVSGYYSLSLQNGTYNLSYSKAGFDTGYLEVMVSGVDNTGADMTIYDGTPPAAVTGLRNDKRGQTSVNLSWDSIADANYYQVFRNSISLGYARNSFWNDRGLSPDTSYEYMVRANDSYNNWGQNSSVLTVRIAFTEPSPVGGDMPAIIGFAPSSPVSNIAGEARTFNMTTNQMVNVTWRINGTPVQLDENKSSADYTNTSAAYGTWIVNATAINANGTISKEWTWNVIPSLMIPSTTAAGTGMGSGSGGGGGGGGGTSGESYTNIEVKEKYDNFILKDILTSYRFISNNNPILFVNITGNVNAGEINTAVEVLRNTSSLVEAPAPATVYKNINIWVGTSGFAVPRNIKTAVIRFAVPASWLGTHNLAPGNIKMLRWEGSKWVTLDTEIKENDGINTYFEAMTDSFSPFAITGVRAKGATAPATHESSEPAATSTPASIKPEGAPGFEAIIAGAALSAIYIFGRRRRRKY